MSTATWTTHEKELPAREMQIGQAGAIYNSAAPAPVAAAEEPDLSPLALKVIVLTLVSGALFLAALGAWVWYAAYQYQNIG